MLMIRCMATALHSASAITYYPGISESTTMGSSGPPVS